MVNGLQYSVGCRQLTLGLAGRFKTYPPLRIFIEYWMLNNLSEDKIYPAHMKYLNQSIYKHSYGFLFRRIPLSPNVQVNNIYFGTDKLSHFTSTSISYVKKYLKLIDKGYSDEIARKRAIDKGIFKENTILGLKFIGVYSYADLEANYQGFKFYKKMCLDENSYLKKDDQGFWEVARYADINDDVSPYWDESFNLSYRSEKNWFHTSKVIKDEYCPIYYSPRVQARLEYYQSILKQSFSVKYIQELQKNNSSSTPIPYTKQSIVKLCEKT